MDDCDHLSGLGDDAQAWDNLDDDELKQVIAVKFIEYGATQDGARIAGLFALYRYSLGRLGTEERAALLTEFSGLIAQNVGLGQMGLMMTGTSHGASEDDRYFQSFLPDVDLHGICDLIE